MATLVAEQPKNRCFRGARCLQTKFYPHDMLMQKTFDSWTEQKVLLETQYPYLVDRPVKLNRSQVVLSSVDELHDEINPFDINFCPKTVQQGREFDEFVSQELGFQRLPTGGSINDKRQLQDTLESETIY
jgi:hypothetical protein